VPVVDALIEGLRAGFDLREDRLSEADDALLTHAALDLLAIHATEPDCSKMEAAKWRHEGGDLGLPFNNAIPKCFVGAAV
jgi:hypothetical protein